MTERTIRTVKVEEFDEFMQYLEDCFGHSRTFFKRFYPHIYLPSPEACTWGHVVEENGEIVSHVGVYPIEVVTAGVHLSLGGIGGVGTAVKAREQGHMTALLHHAIGVMRDQGYAASWLGGDRQRYNTFGWEYSGLTYELMFSRRSLEWSKVEPVPLEQRVPWEAKDVIAQFQSHTPCHTIRPYLKHQLHKQGLRVWVSEDGYAIVYGEERDHIKIMELVSTSGREAGMIRTMLDDTFGERATWPVSKWDQERLARVIPYVGYWRANESGMYRIVNLTKLLKEAQTFLTSQAVGLLDFEVAIGIKEHDRTDVVTVSVQNGQVNIQSGKHTSTYIELSPIHAVRLFLGGPAIPAQSQLPMGLRALLPVPIYVPPLDHV